MSCMGYFAIAIMIIIIIIIITSIGYNNNNYIGSTIIIIQTYIHILHAHMGHYNYSSSTAIAAVDHASLAWMHASVFVHASNCNYSRSIYINYNYINYISLYVLINKQCNMHTSSSGYQYNYTESHRSKKLNLTLH